VTCRFCRLRLRGPPRRVSADRTDAGWRRSSRPRCCRISAAHSQAGVRSRRLAQVAGRSGRGVPAEPAGSTHAAGAAGGAAGGPQAAGRGGRFWAGRVPDRGVRPAARIPTGGGLAAERTQELGEPAPTILIGEPPALWVAVLEPSPVMPTRAAADNPERAGS